MNTVQVVQLRLLVAIASETTTTRLLLRLHAPLATVILGPAVLCSARPNANAAATTRQYSDLYLTGCHPMSARYAYQNAFSVPPFCHRVFATYRLVKETSNERRLFDGFSHLGSCMASWSLGKIDEFRSLLVLRGLPRGTHLS